MIKNPSKVKVGDKVKWYGKHYEPKDGFTRKMIRVEFEKLADEVGGWERIDIDEFRKFVFKPLKYRRGVSTIIGIDTELLGDETLVELSNGVSLVLEKNTVRIKKY